MAAKKSSIKPVSPNPNPTAKIISEVRETLSRVETYLESASGFVMRLSEYDGVKDSVDLRNTAAEIGFNLNVIQEVVAGARKKLEGIKK